MPTAMTFTSLQADVRSYCERGGSAVDTQFNTQLPGFINLRERQIARELKIQGFINNVNTAYTTSVGVYQKPDRWRETISINVGTNVGTATTFNTRVTLLPRSYEYIRTYWPDDTQTGTPKYYADYDYNHLIFVPTPSVPETRTGSFHCLTADNRNKPAKPPGRSMTPLVRVFAIRPGSRCMACS